MDYVEVFQHLKTNNKYGRKSPHKAVLMLTVIELYEHNVLSENEIFYDDTLKSMFLKVWNRVLPNEPLFQPEAYLPFWYLQSDSFWHIVPVRGKEDILTLMRDANIKPSEAKLNDCVKYAELDEDLYFLMTLPSGRSSLKRTLLEAYTNLTEKQIAMLAESSDNTIDYSLSALSDYERILSQGQDESKTDVVEADNGVECQFQNLNEDLQIVLNLQYYSFLKSHRGERDMFKELCPTVYDLLDKIVNHPIKRGEISPSFAFMYDNFLSDLKISLLNEEGSMGLIDNIEKAIGILRGEKNKEKTSELVDEIESETIHIIDEKVETSVNDLDLPKEWDVEHVYLDSQDNVINKSLAASDVFLERTVTTESRKGKSWTDEEEKLIIQCYQEGKDTATIAKIVGRTEVAIKLRLTKLGLMDYTYGQENVTETPIVGDEKVSEQEEYKIENSVGRCYIMNKNDDIVFTTNGQLKYIQGKLYRLNLKAQCFTVKNMQYNDNVWMMGVKMIVAYSRTLLFQIIDNAVDYCSLVDDIIDSPAFEDCKIKVNGTWFDYEGNVITNDYAQNDDKRDYSKHHSYLIRIKSNPLYAVRKQAILHAFSLLRVPATIREIARSISRTAWRAAINENDVKEILNTLSEVESLGDKYILRSKHRK